MEVEARGPLRESESIETLEGTMHADVGDYVIRGVAGEQYPIKPEIFRQTYEDVAMAEHTSLPWKISNGEIQSDTGWPIARMDERGPEHELDARLIVEAVNRHAELTAQVEALTEALQFIADNCLVDDPVWVARHALRDYSSADNPNAPDWYRDAAAAHQLSERPR